MFKKPDIGVIEYKGNDSIFEKIGSPRERIKGGVSGPGRGTNQQKRL